MELTNKIALVTGGSQRIGKAIALALAQAGAHVAISYNTSAGAAQATVAEIKALGRRSIALPCNQREWISIQSLFDSLRHEFDRIDILVNNAAIMERQPVLEVTSDDFDRTMETNLRGPFFIAQAATKWMKEAGNEGSIVNIADLAGIHPWPSYIAHTISKSGVVAMTQALALALAPSIRVNAIAPGVILKPAGWSDDRWNNLIAALPLKRAGTIEDVTQAVLFCLQNNFMTGETIVLDGGRSLR